MFRDHYSKSKFQIKFSKSPQVFLEFQRFFKYWFVLKQLKTCFKSSFFMIPQNFSDEFYLFFERCMHFEVTFLIIKQVLNLNSNNINQRKTTQRPGIIPLAKILDFLRQNQQTTIKMSSKQGCTFGDQLSMEQFHFQTQPSIGQIQPDNNKPDVQSKDSIGSNQQLYKDIMYGSRPSDYQSLLYENKIQLLQDRLQCYQEEIQNLKKTNAILNMKADKIIELEKQLQDKNDQLFQLRDLICAHQDKNQELRRQNQDRVAFFKQKLEEMSQNAEQIKSEQQKIIIRQKDEITTLKQNLSSMATKLSHYERKVHSLQIQRLNSEQDETERDSIFHQRNSMASRFSSQNSENVNSMNLEKSRVSVEEKARQFMRRDQNELKIMMKSLSTAQKCLQMGGQELSMIGIEKEEKSVMEASRMTKSKFNKTYFK